MLLSKMSSPDRVKSVVRLRLFALTMFPLVVATLWSPAAWDSPEVETSFTQVCVQRGETSELGESLEEGEARRSCIRAFFLLSWRKGPRAGEGLQMLMAEFVLVRQEPSGRLRRLSQDGHVLTPSS